MQVRAAFRVDRQRPPELARLGANVDPEVGPDVDAAVHADGLGLGGDLPAGSNRQRPRTAASRRRLSAPDPAGGGRCVGCDLVDELEIRFTETEVAQILWVLSEAAEHAGESDALASLAFDRGDTADGA